MTLHEFQEIWADIPWLQQSARRRVTARQGSTFQVPSVHGIHGNVLWEFLNKGTKSLMGSRGKLPSQLCCCSTAVFPSVPSQHLFLFHVALYFSSAGFFYTGIQSFKQSKFTRINILAQNQRQVTEGTDDKSFQNLIISLGTMPCTAINRLYLQISKLILLIKNC